MHRQRMVLVAPALFVFLGGWPGILAAQEVEHAGLRVTVEGPAIAAPLRSERPEWGGTAYSVRTVQALGFQERSSGMTFSYLDMNRYRTSLAGHEWFDFPLTDLPAGALITGLELQGCDINAAADTSVLLLALNALHATVLLGSVSTGDPQTPGCGFFGGVDNLIPHTVDNFNNAYVLRAGLAAGDTTTSFGAVRVFYKLQVSPSPAVATFPADVPTSHPFFRFIEALAAAGITGGCGPGAYCPDQPITRGQMAVFLSVALGLHFPF